MSAVIGDGSAAKSEGPTSARINSHTPARIGVTTAHRAAARPPSHWSVQTYEGGTRA